MKGKIFVRKTSKENITKVVVIEEGYFDIYVEVLTDHLGLAPKGSRAAINKKWFLKNYVEEIECNHEWVFKADILGKKEKEYKCFGCGTKKIIKEKE